MGTFKKKPEIVDARQFEGGVQNGSNLALWVNSNGQLTETRAEYQEEFKSATGWGRAEHIRVRTYSFRSHVYEGDWIILKQDGSFDTMRPQEFAAEYEQV